MIQSLRTGWIVLQPTENALEFAVTINKWHPGYWLFWAGIAWKIVQGTRLSVGFHRHRPYVEVTLHVSMKQD